MPVYLNPAQQYLIGMNPRDLVAVCGRGFGKSVIQAFRILDCVKRMPRSSGGMVGPSVKLMLRNILPSITQHFEAWGYMRDIHWVVGKRPPRQWHWPEPLIRPDNYDNVISFWNGTVLHLISQDRSGTSNSMSLDWLAIDEAKFIDFEQLKQETFQANRGQEQFFHNCFLHHGMTITGDMPITQEGSWFLRYREMQDPEILRIIEGLVYQRARLLQGAEKHGMTPRIELNIKKTDKNLAYFRSQALLYKEYSSLENLTVLGKKYFYDMKRNLPRLTFQTSVMCQRIEANAMGFYSALKNSILYSASDINYIDGLEYDREAANEVDSRWDADVDPNRPLIVGFDANANINCLVVGQTARDNSGRLVLRILKSFYVKYDRKLPELIEDFCKYYKYHKHKKVIFYYDSTFVGNNYALQNDDFAHFIKYEFMRQGWQVADEYVGRPMEHRDKQLLISRMMKGNAKLQIMINRDNNPDLLIALRLAGVKDNKKDKSKEKYQETSESPLESRTDFTDAFDTVCIGAEKFPRYDGVSGLGAGGGL